MSKTVTVKPTRIDQLLKLGDKITAEQKEELEYLQSKQRIDGLKQTISTGGSFFNTLYASDSPRKDAIERWALELEMQFNYEKSHGIETAIKSVGSISTYIKSEMKSLGVSESVYSYVHKVLMFKYKGDDPNANHVKNEFEGNDSLQSSSLNIDHSAENKILIETFCDNQQKMIDKRREAYTKFSIVGKLTMEERLLLNSNLLNLQASQLIESESYDNRQKIPKLYQQFLFDAFMVQTNNEATGLYWIYVKLMNEKESERRTGLFVKTAKTAINSLSEEDKKLFTDTMLGINKLRKIFRNIIQEEDSEFLNTTPDLTPKQAKKFVSGFVPELLDMLNPKTRNEAILKGFYGVECPKCGDWKVERRLNDAHESICFCHACNGVFETKSYPMCNRCRLPFFDDYLKIMRQKAAYVAKQSGTPSDGISEKCECPKCGNEVILNTKLMAKVVIRN